MIDQAGIYLLTSPSGKSYVGLTTKSFRTRFRTHQHDAQLCSRNAAIQRAIRKYGFDNFTKQILLISNDEYYLKFMEPKIIELYDTYNYGYNSTKGGEISPAKDPEVAKRISRALKGKKKSKQHCENMSKSLKGKRSRRVYATGPAHHRYGKRKA